MASVAPRTATEIRADHALTYLLQEWAALPEIGAAWDAWDEADRLDFVLEWPLREDRLLQLQQWSAAGQLTSSRSRRYEELEALVQPYRPTLPRLLAD